MRQKQGKTGFAIFTAIAIAVILTFAAIRNADHGASGEPEHTHSEQAE